MSAAVRKLKLGPNLEPETTQGPLVNEAAVRKVKEHVLDAVKKGAKMETSHEEVPKSGFFFPPTVLSGVTRDM